MDNQMYKNGIQSYRKTKVVTADPGKLVLMCYEAAIYQLKLAKQKYNEKSYEEKYNALVKAHDIIDELSGSLNFEKGGDIARNLLSLYLYMKKRIAQADVEKDLEGFNEVIRMLEELKSAWETVFNQQADKNSSKKELGNDLDQPQSPTVLGRMRA